MELQTRSRYTCNQEDYRLVKLEIRRKLVSQLLEESKSREGEHFQRALQLAA